MRRSSCRLGVDVIVATGLRENQALRKATATIPVVMVVVDDPVEAGFAQSLARPGGNFTGLAFSATGVGGKYVELLKETVPSLARVAILASRPPRPAFLKEMEDAARKLKVATVAHDPGARSAGELEPAFARAAARGNRWPDLSGRCLRPPPSSGDRGPGRQHRIPAIYAFGEVAEAGGLMAYGPSFPGRFRQAATFVDKILGARSPRTCRSSSPRRSSWWSI